jgi:hypothetical protein
MTPEQFIDKWRGTTRTERSAAHEHFLDLCELLGVPKPGDVDRHGTEYTFEKSTRKIGDATGFADVWKRHCFAWEYKKHRRNLVEAYSHLKQYADALENPPLLIVSDMQEIRVHTNFTNTIATQQVIPLAELRSVSDWPEADVIIGNPPFLGGKLMRTVLGDDYVDRLFAAYASRVPAEADLVCYWFAKAWERLSLSALGGGEGRGEVGDQRLLAEKPTSPSRADGAGPSLSP